MNQPTDDFLLYDGECPVCSSYVAWTGLSASRPGIRLLDAREEPEVVAWVRHQGIEINDSFCLRIDGQLISGAAAMALIGTVAQPTGFLARLVVATLAHRRIGQPLYPLLVQARKLLLWMLGRKLIR